MAKLRIGSWVGPILILAAIAAAVWGYRRIAPYGQIGATYIAKQYCSCVFVSGRSDASCRTDFEPDIDKFSVRADRSGLPASGRVTARLFVFSSEARFAHGQGCSITR